MAFPNTHPIVDISYWNTAGPNNTHTIDTDRLTDAGIRAVLVRAGKGNPDLDADHGIDRHYHQTVLALEAAGIPWVPYWRIHDIWYEQPEPQADRFSAALNASHGTGLTEHGPVMIDAEEWVKASEAPNHQLGPGWVAGWLKRFRQRLSDNGHDHHIAYTRKSWWDDVARLQLRWGHLPLYVAHWVRDASGTPIPVPTDDARVWDEFVTRHRPAGPNIPAVWPRWSGWQFAGEGSNAGRGLGFASQHLDCGLLRSDVFDAWFSPG